MNDGMYTNIRNYLEETNSLLRQILDEQKRTNEMLATLAYPNAKSDEPIRPEAFLSDNLGELMAANTPEKIAAVKAKAAKKGK